MLCIGLMLCLYLCLFEKEKAYKFNRFFLLFGLLFSLLVPFIPITVYQEIPLVQIPLQDEIVQISNTNATPLAAVPENRYDYLVPILLFIYGIVVIYLLYRSIRNITVILLAAHRNKRVPYENAALVLIPETEASHTFLNYIFINKEAYNEKTIAKELLSHELVHVRQKHSLDILFIEFISIIFWFNPVFLFYKKAIQLNHEFLADQAVLAQYNNVKEYQALLLSKIGLLNPILLTNSFSYLVTKKRLTMMTKNLNKTRVACKQFSLLPILASLVLLFSTKVSANIEGSHSPEGKAKPHSMQHIETVPDTVNRPSFIEVMPAFPGGIKKFIDFLTSHIDPDGASGIVETTFYLDKDGNVNIPNNASENAVLKAVAESPKWLPAIQNEVPIKVAYAVRANFETVNQKKTVAIEKFAMIKKEMIVSTVESKKDNNTLIIKGIVSDKDGNPIAHASVATTDYKNWTISDDDGSFTLFVPNKQGLTVSCVGHTTWRSQP